MQLPNSTRWSVISLIFVTSVIVAPLTIANHRSGSMVVSTAVASERVTPSPTPLKNKVADKESPELAVVITTPTPKNSELVDIVAYIAQVFEPEGKEVVVQAINCFYSESGLREDAVGQNTDEHRSKDHGVAQLNDYWHSLTPQQKTDYKANIDKAYDIYKGRGGNFSAWYGKRCN